MGTYGELHTVEFDPQLVDVVQVNGQGANQPSTNTITLQSPSTPGNTLIAVATTRNQTFDPDSSFSLAVNPHPQHFVFTSRFLPQATIRLPGPKVTVVVPRHSTMR